MARWHGLGWTPATSADVDRELTVQRVVTLLRNQPVTAAANVINSLTLTTFAASEGDVGASVFVLQSILLVAAGFQFRSWWRHRKRPMPFEVSERAPTRAVFYALAFGVLWGLYSAALLLSQVSLGVDLLIGIVTAGMMAGGATMLFVIPAGVAAFLLGITPPPFLAFFIRGEPFAELLAVYALIYITCLMAAARTWHGGFFTGVSLRLRNIELAARAEAANRAKSKFLANMSHELRTPLNAIVGFAEMIDGQFHGPVGNARYLEFARAIRDGGAHLGAVIDDILDISKIEAGKVDLVEANTDVAALIDEALLLVKPAIERAELSVSVSHEPNRLDLIADGRRLRQCIVNVLSNAVKFTPPGGKIRIETRRSSTGALLIMIADSGVGIDRADLGDIVKPFVQGRNADLQRQRGAGLGLSIAEQLVQLHGGSLSITSSPGNGTVVTVTLPSSRLTERRAVAAS